MSVGANLRFKIGQVVICIDDPLSPEYVGTIWTIEKIVGVVYLCSNPDITEFNYAFRDCEVAEVTPLILELF